MIKIGSSILHIRKLRLMVHLGCTAEERKTLQPVELDIMLRFHGLPAGTESDNLSETICYSEIAGLLRELISKKEFNLIERLALELFQALKEKIPTASAETWISAVKLNPPVQDLNGGVSFSFGDWVPGLVPI
jgi:dihydroneopterin aldolase